MFVKLILQPDLTHLTDLGVSGPFLVTPIKQIRVFVELILQPEMELSEIVPDPRHRMTINTERDESSQTHHTVFTTLRSFRDK